MNSCTFAKFHFETVVGDIQYFWQYLRILLVGLLLLSLSNIVINTWSPIIVSSDSIFSSIVASLVYMWSGIECFHSPFINLDQVSPTHSLDHPKLIKMFIQLVIIVLMGVMTVKILSKKICPIGGGKVIETNKSHNFFLSRRVIQKNPILTKNWCKRVKMNQQNWAPPQGVKQRFGVN